MLKPTVSFDPAIKDELPVIDRTDIPRDDVDKAAVLQDQMNEAGLAGVRAAMAPESAIGFDGETCFECGDDMPPERLAAGRIRCFHCQTNIEDRKKRYGTN